MGLEIVRRTHTVVFTILDPFGTISVHNYLALVDTSQMENGVPRVLAELHGGPTGIPIPLVTDEFSGDLFVHENTPELDAIDARIADLTGGEAIRMVGELTPGNAFDGGVTVFSSADEGAVLEVWASARTAGADLHAQQLPYLVFEQNSNSAERTLSTAAGIPWFQVAPADIGDKEFVAPASGNTLVEGFPDTAVVIIDFEGGVPGILSVNPDVGLLGERIFVEVTKINAVYSPLGNLIGYDVEGQAGALGVATIRYRETDSVNSEGDRVYKTTTEYENSTGVVTAYSTGQGDGAGDFDLSIVHGFDGTVQSVQEADKPPVVGTAIGEAFGSSLGQYIAGDNVFAQIGRAHV